MHCGTTVPFDSEQAFVVRSSPVKSAECGSVDQLGRTEGDKLFLEQFERIFRAAYKGNLTKCKRIVKEGFCDFEAFRVGGLDTKLGDSFDKISPLKIAEMRGHTNIVEYFLNVSKDSQNCAEGNNLEKTVEIKSGISSATSTEKREASCILATDEFSVLVDQRGGFDLNQNLLASYFGESEGLKKTGEIKSDAPSNEHSELVEFEVFYSEGGDLLGSLNFTAGKINSPGSSVTSLTLIEAMRASAPDEELSALVDQVEIFDLENNPLEHILNHNGSNPEKAIQKMVEKCPVAVDHIKKALIKKYSEETVSLMLKKADKEIDTRECIRWLLGKYSEGLIAQFINHASRVKNRYVIEAFKANFSAATIELFVDRVPKVNEDIWEEVFPEKKSMNVFKQVCKRHRKKTGENSLTPEFFRKYWKHFKTQDKPYLPHLTRFSSAFIKKLINKSSCIPFGIEKVLGQVEEEVIWSLLEKEISVDSSQFKHVLLYGYSEKLVLYLSKKFEELDEDIVEIAQLRGYSEELIQELKKKCPNCILM